MAMQCSFSRRGAVLLAATALAACQTTTTVTYLPTAERARMTLEQGSATLVQFMQVQCGELQAAGGPDSVIARVVVDDSAHVRESELISGTGSEAADNIIGAITAQLTLAQEPQVPPAGPASVVANFSCTSPVRATLRLLP